jgi:hypothetical protein
MESNEETPAEPTTYTIGGLQVHVHGLSTTNNAPRTVLFLLHGRLSTHADFDPLIAKFDLAKLNAQAKRRQL